jgi:hypothetical protein
MAFWWPVLILLIVAALALACGLLRPPRQRHDERN